MERRILLATLVVGLLSACPEKPGTGNPDGGDGGAADAGTDGGGSCTFDLECDPQLCVSSACIDACVDDASCLATETCNLLTGRCDPLPPICTAGEVRCAIDGTQSVETCAPDELSWSAVLCIAPTPSCFAAGCVGCAPGATSCNGDIAQTCLPDGSGTTDLDCASVGATCNGGVCQVCTANVTECKDASTARTCNTTGTAWTETPCVNGFCDNTLGDCVVTTCTAGATRCSGDELLVCNAAGDGFVLQEDCAANGAVCQGAACVDLCAAAVASNSYIGCEYWPTILSNGELIDQFRVDFQVVVSNPNAGTTAQISVFEANNPTPVVTATVAGGQLTTLNLPWNALDAWDALTGESQTQMGAIAYQLVSSVPVTAYQFNPLSNHIRRGNKDSFTNDASLLLPSHIYGNTAATPASRYLAMTAPHIVWEPPQSLAYDVPAFIAVVASSPGITTVTVRLNGGLAAGGGLDAADPGETVTFSLQQFEVMQLASRPFGTGVTVTNANGVDHTNYPDSDLSGSLVESDQPVAVYAGADCHFVPFDQQSCDHLEQQMFPFANWGSRYVAARSEYLNNPFGDVWRILAAVDGTTLTFTPASVSGTQNLNAGDVFELSGTDDFLVESQGLDHPIMMAQFFPGIEVTGLDRNNRANTGDPTMILAIPIEQFKESYAFITPGTFVQNYMNVTRPAGVAVLLDGTPVSPPNGWAPVGTSGLEVGRVPLDAGPHQLDAAGSVGLSVYGFDFSVSYGYPGGLDLKQIVVIAPGG